MIAAYGYDGFLYSIGFLAGWVVALFVIAEPMKRMGKFTFADALDAKFNSRGIKGAAGVSTLVVSIFYLIPQMVGAGSLIQPLLGLPHWVGVVMVGVVVIMIVVTAGMVSTTWVQFLKGSLLVIFSTVLVVMLLQKGLTTDTSSFQTIGPLSVQDLKQDSIEGRKVIPATDGWQGTADKKQEFIRFIPKDGRAGYDVFHIDDVPNSDQKLLRQAQAVTGSGASKLVDGAPNGRGEGERELQPIGHLSKLPGGETSTGPLGPISFFTTIGDSEVILWGNTTIVPDNGPKNNGLLPKANRRRTCSSPRRTPKICRHSRRKFW